MRLVAAVFALLCLFVAAVSVNPPNIAMAQTWPTPCDFTGFGPGGGIVHTNITCATPIPATTFTPNPTESAILAQASTTHLWGFHDLPNGCASNCTPGPCPSTMADLIATGATAAPSPAALLSTPGASVPICGNQGLIRDNSGTKTSASMCSDAAIVCNSTNYFAIPQAAEPASGSFTLGCVYQVATETQGQTDALWSIDASDHAVIYTEAAGATEALRVSANQANIAYTNAATKMLVYTWDGSNSRIYENGVLLIVYAHAPTFPSANGHFGLELSAHNFSGRIQDCWFANTAWSQALINTVFQNSGL